MSGLTVNLQGFASLEQRLRSLSGVEATRAAQAANRAGGVVLVKAVKAAAPIGPLAEGATVNRKRKSGKVVQEQHHKIINWIKVKKTRATTANTVQTSVGVVEGFHASMLEFGSIHTPATHWFRNAFEAAKPAVIDKMKEMLERQLIKRGV